MRQFMVAQYPRSVDVQTRKEGYYPFYSSTVSNSRRTVNGSSGKRPMVRQEGENVENGELPQLIANAWLTVQLHHCDLNVFGNYVSGYTCLTAEKSPGFRNQIKSI